VGFGGIYTNPTSSSTNEFKLREYRDLDSGRPPSWTCASTGGEWWARLFGENIGRDDQFLEVKGGKYGVVQVLGLQRQGRSTTGRTARSRRSPGSAPTTSPSPAPRHPAPTRRRGIRSTTA
jgi:hypothetical protein